MRFVRAFRVGLRQTSERPKLVFLVYVITLVPALGLTILALATVAPAWSRSLFAQEVLSGSWFGVWRDFAKSPENHLPLVLGPGLLLAVLAAVVAQVVLSAGIFSSLFGDRADQGGGFLRGVRHFSLPLFRSFLWFALGLGLAVAACGAVIRGFFKLAENQADARWDLVGGLAAALLFALLYVPLRGAYDFSRLAVVRHGDRKTLRGYLRALGAVMRYPLLFFPLYASFLVAMLALHGAFGLARSQFTVASWLGIAAVALMQQVVMGVRAFLRLGFLAASMEAYRMLGEDRYCQGKAQQPEIFPQPVPAEEVFT